MGWRRPTTIACGRCRKTVAVGPIGRVPIYCSPSCRTAACAAKRGPKNPIEDRIARRVWQALVDCDLIPDRPLPPRREERA